MNYIVNRLDEEKLDYEMHGVGVSMGANLLLRYQALSTSSSKFKSLISICNPFDVLLGSNLMKNTYFEKYIALSAKTSVLRAIDFPEIKSELIQKFKLDF
jgi:predicted alpha/beta-fold hydrolase